MSICKWYGGQGHTFDTMSLLSRVVWPISDFLAEEEVAEWIATTRSRKLFRISSTYFIGGLVNCCGC